jgi:hypothetical protein
MMEDNEVVQVAGETPRPGYGWISPEKQCQEIIRRLSDGQREAWIMKEATRFDIYVPPVGS